MCETGLLVEFTRKLLNDRKWLVSLLQLMLSQSYCRRRLSLSSIGEALRKVLQVFIFRGSALYYFTLELVFKLKKSIKFIGLTSVLFSRSNTKYFNITFYYCYWLHLHWFKHTLTLYTLTSVFIFSLLFSVHLLRCWQGEFV